MSKNDKGKAKGSGGDPSHLPTHLRAMVGGAPAPASRSAPPAKAAPTAPAPDSAAAGKASWKVFLRNWWFVLFVMPALVYLRCNVWSPYKIPTGSMEPQLLGSDNTGDRVLVNLLAYHSSDPQRWDIAVFKSPKLRKTARSIADSEDIDYVKRCVGVAGDRIVISGGDLYTVVKTADGQEQFQPLRKPAALQKTVWHTLYNFPYDFPWENPTSLIRHGEWEVTPETACTPAEDLKSFHLAAADQGSWRLTLKRSTQPILRGRAEPTAVAGPVAPPVAGPVAPAVAGPVSPAVAGPVAPPGAEEDAPGEPAGPPLAAAAVETGAPQLVSLLSNRYLKSGDYWFRIPDTGLAPFRAHIRGSESVLLVPDDIHPEFPPQDPTALDPQVRAWKGKRLYPAPLDWYAGRAEIETDLPQSAREQNAELWRLTDGETAAYVRSMHDDRLPPNILDKQAAYRGTSIRRSQAYGGQFGANDVRIELQLEVQTWGRQFRLVFDQELAADGNRVVRRYGFTVENGQAQPWVEGWDATAQRWQPVARVAVDGATPMADAPLPAGTGPQRWALEHFDSTIRLVQLDLAGTTEQAVCGFAYLTQPRAMKQHSAGLYLEGAGSNVTFRRIQIARDLYYLWDEFKLLQDNGIGANLYYRTSNAGFMQMPDQFLVHRADGLTEFDLTVNAGDPRLARYLMCGDNTVSSIDSRWFGPVERWRFSGKYAFTFWPPSRAAAVR